LSKIIQNLNGTQYQKAFSEDLIVNSEDFFSKIPVSDYENLQPFKQTEKIYFTESTTDDNYNFRNFYNGIYGYEIQGGLINYSGLTMSLNKDNEMTIQLTNNASLLNSYNIVSIKLIKQ
jgi:hypothetical protein